MRGFAARTIPNLIVFLSGLAIMLLELVASRLVAKHLGLSLEIWTTVIAVILGGMSLGNYLGGRLSDLRDPIRTLPWLLGGSAVLCFSVLLTNDLVGGSTWMANLPSQLRIVSTITLVFFPPACALGTIQPTVARWAIAQSTRTGSAFGNIGAWATTGNILGTFLTGFVLLTVFGVRSIVETSVIVLAATGAGLLALSFRFPIPKAQVEQHPRPNVRYEVVLKNGWGLLMPNLFVFSSGLSIMMVELVGGRMLARATGTSIYTWTSLIGVVLAGIAVGNYLGGKLADRFEPGKTLPHLFVVSSILCALLLAGDPLLDSPSVGTKSVDWLFGIDRTALRGTEEASRVAAWAMPAGMLASVSLVFFGPTCALGTISPVAAKLALERAQKAGRALGNVYAWGTIGSIVGSFLAGFVLIPVIGTKAVLCIVAGLLALVSVCMVTSGLGHAVWAGIVLAMSVAVMGPERWPWLTGIGYFLKLRKQIPEGEYHRESKYYYIKVQPSDEHPDAIELVLDNLVHGYVLEGKPRDLRYDYELIYAAIMERAGALPVPDDSGVESGPHSPSRKLRTFFIGGGSYTFPRYIEAAYPGSTMIVAEIDPAVTRANHKALFLPEDTPIVTLWGDARGTIDRLIRERAEPFDFILGDAFNDFSVPWHLTTLEFNEKIKKLLKPDGVYMINIIDNYKYSKFLGACVHTARSSFSNVAVFGTSSTGPTMSRETFVIAMSNDAELDFSDLGTRSGEREFEGSLLTDSQVDDAVQRAGDMRLTDDFAPVENLIAPVARERDL